MIGEVCAFLHCFVIYALKGFIVNSSIGCVSGYTYKRDLFWGDNKYAGDVFVMA